MTKRWRIQPHDAARIAQLERSAGVSAVVAQLLIARGIHDAHSARDFLDAKLVSLRDPELLPGVESAAERIHQTIEARQRIVIYGDYDADGMTSTAILFRCLRLLGADVRYYVPCRLEEGYGLNDEALSKLASDGAKLVITVDCGIASVSQAKYARELGLPLIITDHHEMADELPDADAIVHPRLPGHSYPFGGLCGAGVAFKLAWAVCQKASGAKKVSERMRSFLMSAMGLAAIGTVADVVPLMDENRILVRHGLKSLKAHPPLGLEKLMQVTDLHKKPALGADDVAFSIGPRLNAAGRLGQAQLAVELLTTDSAERATALAEYIHELNSQRDSLERSIYLAANKQVKENFHPEHEPALVLNGRGWHPGVIGIVASRLVDKYHRPVVIIAQDNLGIKSATGSGRSACGVNLHEAFAACTEHLVGHGGHAAAAGLRIEDDNIDGFREAFCEYVAGELTEENRTAEVHIDAEAPFSQLTLQTVEQIETLAPFGQGNPRPVLCCSDIELPVPPKTMGGGDRHLNAQLRHGQVTLRAVAFGKGEWAESLSKHNGPVEIAYRPVINEFRGRRNVEIHLVDWRPARSLAEAT